MYTELLLLYRTTILKIHARPSSWNFKRRKQMYRFSWEQIVSNASTKWAARMAVLLISFASFVLVSLLEAVVPARPSACRYLRLTRSPLCTRRRRAYKTYTPYTSPPIPPRGDRIARRNFVRVLTYLSFDLFRETAEPRWLTQRDGPRRYGYTIRRACADARGYLAGHSRPFEPCVTNTIRHFSQYNGSRIVQTRLYRDSFTVLTIGLHTYCWLLLAAGGESMDVTCLDAPAFRRDDFLSHPSRRGARAISLPATSRPGQRLLLCTKTARCNPIHRSREESVRFVNLR